MPQAGGLAEFRLSRGDRQRRGSSLRLFVRADFFANDALLCQAFMFDPLHSARGSFALLRFDQLGHAPVNFVTLYAGEAKAVESDVVQCLVWLRH